MDRTQVGTSGRAYRTALFQIAYRWT